MAYGNQKQFDDNNRGALFAREKRSAKSPDMGGDFILGGEVLDYVKRCMERGEEVKLEISAWRKMSKNSTPFTSIQIDIPWQVKKGPGNAPITPYQGQQRQQGFANQQRNPNVRQGGYDQRGGYAEQRGGGYDTGVRSGGYVDDRGSTSGGRFDDSGRGKPEWDR